MPVTRHQAVGAFRPWQPPSFDEQEPTAEPAETAEATEAKTPPPPVETAPEPPPEPPEPEFHLPTADEIEQVYEQARQEGYDSGHAAGHAEGYQAGQALAKAEAQRLATLVDEIDTAFNALDADVAEELVTLAITVARQLVGKAVTMDPAAVLHVVREALQQLPQNKVRIHINPEDAAAIREHLGEQLDQGHHQLIADETVARGGCRLESGTGEVDATLETRWRRVIATMGREAEPWGDPHPAEDSG